MASARRKYIIDHIKHIPAKVLCILVLIFQGGVLDYFLINNEELEDNTTCSVFYSDSPARYAWPVGDVIILVVFCFAFHQSTQVLQRKHKPKDKKIMFECLQKFGDLPLGYISWLLLAVINTTRVVLIFKNTARCLDEENFFGPNILKIAVGLTSVVFLLHVLGHHDAKKGSERKHYVEHLLGGITFDILDSVDHLDILFEEKCTCLMACPMIDVVPAENAPESVLYDLPCSLENAILAFSCINLILPTFPLAVLSLSNYGHKMSSIVAVIHTALYILLVNVPFFAIRMVLWHQYNKDISVFLLKNIIMITMGVSELFEHGGELRHKEKKEIEECTNIEMKDKGTAPTDSDIVPEIRDDDDDSTPVHQPHKNGLSDTEEGHLNPAHSGSTQIMTSI